MFCHYLHSFHRDYPITHKQDQVHRMSADICFCSAFAICHQKTGSQLALAENINSGISPGLCIPHPSRSLMCWSWQHKGNEGCFQIALHTFCAKACNCLLQQDVAFTLRQLLAFSQEPKSRGVETSIISQKQVTIVESCWEIVQRTL